MNILNELIQKYRSDKNVSNYTPIYEKEFEGIKDTITSILEIGLGTIIPGVHSSMHDWKTSRVIDGENFNDYMPGASLRAWKEYFTNAQIYGGDVQEDTQFEEERIKTFLFNSTNLEECDKYLEDLKEDRTKLNSSSLNSIQELLTLYYAKLLSYELKFNGKTFDIAKANDVTHLV